MDEREQFYANKAIREIFENRLMGGWKELSDEGLRLMKRYVLFCIESGSEEDLERVLKACMVLEEMKDWILYSPVANLDPVRDRFRKMCEMYDIGELEEFLPFM
jgi:hypothetical protein